jgi:hypothetical protein
MNRWFRRLSLLTVGLLSAGSLASASQLRTVDDDGWCHEGGSDHRARHCEVREVTLPARGRIEVDAHPNGGIDVEGWDKEEIQLQVKVVAQAPSEPEAKKLATQVEVETTGIIRVRGPRTRGKNGWWASFRLKVPAQSNLSLETQNGGIGIEDVAGEIEFRTTNGGVELKGIGGNVHGKTTNGGLRVHLEGKTWAGRGLDVETTNGGVKLMIPEGYSAELETGTTNGRIDVGFPVTVQGRIDKRLNVTLGDGGPTVRAKTTNGGVHVRRR